jgi:pimeloyl-ACP methyl ester carboxylesterase
VSDLRLLLERADARPPYVLVGHSFGGLLVRAFACARPDEVAGLVFVDTLHPEEWAHATGEQRRILHGAVLLSYLGRELARVGVVRGCLAMLSAGASGPPRMFSRLFGSRVARLLERIVGEVQKLPPSALRAVQAHWSRPDAFAGMAHHLAALPTCASEMTRSTETLRTLPIVVLSAANRNPHALALDAALARASEKGRHKISAKAGHWMQLDDPTIVVDAVREVVDRSRAT